MGNLCSSAPKRKAAPEQRPEKEPKAKTSKFEAIPDRYKTLEEVQQAMKRAGLESSNLILGIDYTKSNTWTGEKTFGGKCLHYIDPTGKTMNPYQQVIDVAARTLEPFDDDHLIPCYGFGDMTTTDKGVFPFFPNEAPCNGVAGVLQRYNEVTPAVQMLGPTSFAPIINKAVSIVQQTGQYHILIIIADGQVTSAKATREAIVRASNYPLSIVLVGVGDGPWDMMEEFDDELPERRFDNFQFVNFHEVMSRPHVENYDIEFAVAALMEIPDQYSLCVKLGLL